MSQNVGDLSGACPRCTAVTRVYSYDEAPWGFRGNYSWVCGKCGRFYQSDELDKEGHVFYAFENDSREKAVLKACPCLHVKPCSDACTCADPLMSGGCTRCASYGSPEEQLTAAARIAYAVEEHSLNYTESLYIASQAAVKLGESIGKHVYSIQYLQAQARFRSPVQQVPDAVLAEFKKTKIYGSESMPQPVDHLFQIHPGHALAVCDVEEVVKMRGATTDMLYREYGNVTLDRGMPEVEVLKFRDPPTAEHFDGAIVGDGSSRVLGVDLASGPDETGYVGMRDDGSTYDLTKKQIAALSSSEYVLMDEPVSGPSCIQCIGCVAIGDDTKKVCELRTDTGIEEGWYCEECYQDWKNRPE